MIKTFHHCVYEVGSYKKTISGQRLENIDRTHLVLASGKLVQQKVKSAEARVHLWHFLILTVLSGHVSAEEVSI